MNTAPHRKLPRLDPGHYRGQAYVHWTMAIQGRKTGWLIPTFYYKFREILAHAAFRYSFTCPIYCLMPDHMHLLWIGIDDRSDQLKASEYFRKRLGDSLKKMGCEFQRQAYDNVLRNDERAEAAVSNLVEYIARNPERKNLVDFDQFMTYPYTGCLVPGYPELKLWQAGFWERFWRSYSFLRRYGLFRPAEEQLGVRAKTP
jgi:REP element-mobilizing transposase RayT